MQDQPRKTLGRPAKPARTANTSISAAASTDRTSHGTSKPQVEFETIEIKADSLAFSLVGAAQAVAYVLEGTALPQALTRVFTQTNASPQARGAIQDIAYRTMRQVGRVEDRKSVV